MLATISISAIKPAVVDYVLNHKGEIKTDTYLRYYLEQQLHFLGHNKSEADSYIEKVHKFPPENFYGSKKFLPYS